MFSPLRSFRVESTSLMPVESDVVAGPCTETVQGVQSTWGEAKLCIEDTEQEVDDFATIAGVLFQQIPVLVDHSGMRERSDIPDEIIFAQLQKGQRERSLELQ